MEFSKNELKQLVEQYFELLKTNKKEESLEEIKSTICSWFGTEIQDFAFQHFFGNEDAAIEMMMDVFMKEVDQTELKFTGLGYIVPIYSKEDGVSIKKVNEAIENIQKLKKKEQYKILTVE